MTLYYTNILQLDLYSASSLKQHFTSIYVAPLGHIILIQSQPIFALCPLCCMLNQRSNKYQFHCPWFNTTRESNPQGKLAVHYTTETIFMYILQINVCPFVIFLLATVLSVFDLRILIISLWYLQTLLTYFKFNIKIALHILVH